MKIYLAGKMDAEHGAWRDRIIGMSYVPDIKRSTPRWESMAKNDLADVVNGYVAPAWPSGANTWVIGLHEYVGPYRLTHIRADESKWFGYFHGSMWKGEHGSMDADSQRAITRLCRDAISRCDLFFAYINRPDCFGTLAEIGMARALGKFVYLAIEDDASWEWNDYWFTLDLADCRGYEWDVMGDDPPKDQGERALAYFKDSLVKWTGRPAIPDRVAIVPMNGSDVVTREMAQSFSQIARWSADPRVRDEAQRMLRRITG